MNTPRKYIIRFGSNTYECKNKPELNMQLGKITSGIGRVYDSRITLEIEVVK